MAIIEDNENTTRGEEETETLPETVELTGKEASPFVRQGPWGMHAIFDCGICNEYIKDEEMIKEFAKTLVERIEMKAYGEPQVVKFGEGDKEGYTLVQLIETSNITAHFCDSTHEAYIDVFSCKEFDMEKVEFTIRDYFNPLSIKKLVIHRSA
jgi:S-adenosylmethionine/arginine decarboxylase-like enzyme